LKENLYRVDFCVYLVREVALQLEEIICVCCIICE